MKRVLLLLCVIFSTCGPALLAATPRRTPAVAAATPAREKQHYALYAQIMGNVEVQLASGTAWAVKKGDVFPVMMFKEQQTIAVLQLAGTSFRLATDWIKTIEGKDLTAEQAAAYRATVQSYLDKVAEDAKASLPQGK